MKEGKKKKPSYIYQPDSWTDVLALNAIFPDSSEKRLEVDLGCGKGRFLAARADANPHINFIGVDRLLVRLRKVNSKIHRASLSNVRLLRIEAAYAVEYLFPPESVSTFYIFFPDPWPKKRHHKRRLFSPSFMDSLYKALTPDGKVNIATDHLQYFQEIHDLMTDDKRFAELPAFDPKEEERTDFELIFLEQHNPIGRCTFKKA